MTTKKAPYPKRATDYDTQIKTLRDRGVLICDETKAKEYLADIGYYRLGFYIFPFEVTYPFLDGRRKHDVIPGTTIENIVAFYYYNTDLRNILNRYLSRIEVAIRTTIVYELSNKYRSNPYWYADPSIVRPSFTKDFQRNIYNKTIRTKGPIQRHHKKISNHFGEPGIGKFKNYLTSYPGSQERLCPRKCDCRPLAYQ